MKFKVCVLFTLILCCSELAFGQEICNNAIDDDGDGLVDLNDDECNCLSVDLAETIFPNPSFEDYDCCPDSYSELSCATDWFQASEGTSDYFNTCDLTGYWAYGDILPPSMPLPGDPGDAGYAGFSYMPNTDSYEFLGTNNLDAPLYEGVEYDFSGYLARLSGDTIFNVAIYGSPNELDIPWAGYGCPEGLGDWELIATTPISLDTSLKWYEFSFSFIPTIDINAIAIGGLCMDEETANSSIYIDELSLIQQPFSIDLVSVGEWCEGDLELFASSDTEDGIWQWYKDGVALIGENMPSLNPIEYGPGEFSIVYTIGAFCERIDINPYTPFSTVFEMPDSLCRGDSKLLTVSTLGGLGDFTYEWTANGESLPATGSTLLVIPTETTNYCVTVNDECEFTPSETFCVELYLPEIPVFSLDTNNICAPGEIEFTNLTGPVPLANNCTWLIDGVNLIGNQVYHTFETEGAYDITLNVVTPEGCSTTIIEEALVTIHPLPNPTFIVAPMQVEDIDKFIMLHIVDPDLNSSYIWESNPPLEFQPISHENTRAELPLFDAQTFEIVLLEKNQFGCSNQVTELIKVRESKSVFAPNAFTPDGNSVNAEWGVSISGFDIYDFHLVIYNRWGEMMWESYNPTAKWDGTYGGKLVDTGLYNWMLDVKDQYSDKRQSYSGSVIVLY